MVPLRSRQQLQGHQVIGLLILSAFIAALWVLPAWAQIPASTDIRIALITRQPSPPPLYEFDPVPENEGIAGGQLAIRDNNTTGQFTGHRYILEEEALEEGQDAVAAARSRVASGVGFLAINLPADELLAIADALKDENVVLFNVSATDDRLRGTDCRPNVFHMAPSRAMLTDALAQFLAFKRWRRLFLIVGPQQADKLYAEAMRRSARKFGLVIADEKPWEFGPLARAKADSPTTAEALAVTQNITYDIVVVADEAGDFGDYVAYRTWDPRLVVGTQGLIATTWHPTLEVWGAAQAQTRFRRSAERLMRPLDYQTWMAVRTIGEAITQTKATDPGTVKQFILGADFSLPAYKGVSLSFRPWDRQLRQPLLIVQPRFLVSVAPEKGFLHQRTPLDTLGFDQPETSCKAQ
ncbi:ABC transporter substrate-binding protein [Microvirga sp. ACRRW]|uniref:ABC transporter substrate-binding protein n=1 Tax=Microvirga sp. ACRRW TaxID=2918205 RepID=UPI001EF5EB6C|nr:ABC transporter substrate-binding protein [Microvirga sp. ACRRW]MCG7393803.1 ABC transporter substrate-binding protein [Microvirga sp. ACRRW]